MRHGHYFCDTCDDIAFGVLCEHRHQTRWVAADTPAINIHQELKKIPSITKRQIAIAAFAEMRRLVESAQITQQPSSTPSPMATGPT
jgi:hypothetical protein